MEGGEGNAKMGCGRWMEESGRGAAVEQLTARGMLSIPAMGGNSRKGQLPQEQGTINPRNGGAIESYRRKESASGISIPAMGDNSEIQYMLDREININPRNGGQ